MPAGPASEPPFLRDAGWIARRKDSPAAVAAPGYHPAEGATKIRWRHENPLRRIKAAQAANAALAHGERRGQRRIHAALTASREAAQGKQTLSLNALGQRLNRSVHLLDMRFPGQLPQPADPTWAGPRSTREDGPAR